MLIPELVWVMAAAEETGGSPDIGKILNQFGQYGIVGLVVILLIVGVIVPKYVMNNLMAEKDSWRQAFEKERDAHQLTREQLAKAEERGDVAIEQGKTLTRLLEELGHHPELPRRA
ncbi:hypothetical protein PV733_28035 [Streptomyces europaeiscabiei]|uniref:hypothetical protein n=1 Tax=Streptomyces europaeiscabiei TaxID=146819 RepID=UPI0029B060ED|nr:hypothetical protein [Streptomyces europaeiscabiei]MDX3712720.1 hypothetical protein [Streptomyces europaeiscabiei]